MEPLRMKGLSDESITILENFSNMFSGIERDYAAIREGLSNANQEQEDLLHELELSPFSSYEGFLLAKKLQEVRKRRRELDNDFIILSKLIDFRKTHAAWEVPLYRLLTDMRKTQESLSYRLYSPRIRTDIKLYHAPEVES